MINPFAKRLPKNVLTECRNLRLMVSAEIFKLHEVKGNTARVTNGILWVKQQEEIVLLLQEYFNNYMATEMARLGFKPGTPCTLDFDTGVVIKTPPQNDA